MWRTFSALACVQALLAGLAGKEKMSRCAKSPTLPIPPPPATHSDSFFLCPNYFPKPARIACTHTISALILVPKSLDCFTVNPSGTDFILFNKSCCSTPEILKHDRSLRKKRDEAESYLVSIEQYSLQCNSGKPDKQSFDKLVQTNTIQMNKN